MDALTISPTPAQAVAGDSNTYPSLKPLQVTFALPHAPQTTVFLHLTVLTTSLLLFLTTKTSDAGGPGSLGSFVYALPDRTKAGDVNSTPLYSRESTLEFTTRLARLLARKLQTPTYVGNSMSFESAGLGGSVEEEMDAFREVVRVVMEQVEKVKAAQA
ncbi:MAG: hypothetical protein M1829_005351 [Trizodia sp. TS-e1964]|nr:MAG: hypothetical protein M1829_005351 [Trizodia sp. TS-e1964]